MHAHPSIHDATATEEKNDGNSSRDSAKQILRLRDNDHKDGDYGCETGHQAVAGNLET